MRTTLDADVQRAAEAAVNSRPRASVVALRPSTGEILAIANSGDGVADTALLGEQAPGAVFEIATAAALLESGVVTPDQRLGCPEAGTGTSFAYAFALSCDGAFAGLHGRLPVDALAREARDAFGIGREWRVGISTFDGSMPSDAGVTDRAAVMTGQGGIAMNPPNVASITATVQQGAFRQPPLLPGPMAAVPPVTARPLGGETAEQLREMMRLTGNRAPAPWPDSPVTSGPRPVRHRSTGPPPTVGSRKAPRARRRPRKGRSRRRRR